MYTFSSVYVCEGCVCVFGVGVGGLVSTEYPCLLCSCQDVGPGILPRKV